MAVAARKLRAVPQDDCRHLLLEYWNRRPPEDLTVQFFCRVFLQPYAEHARGRTEPAGSGETALCPFCGRKPVAGVLREEGLGGKKWLLCSFCLGEWEFRRLLCPACGQADPARLAVYTTDEFPQVRVDACQACKVYTKTVDVTRDGQAVPLVDEIAGAALDLWAGRQGYNKLELNLVGL